MYDTVLFCLTPCLQNLEFIYQSIKSSEPNSVDASPNKVHLKRNFTFFLNIYF